MAVVFFNKKYLVKMTKFRIKLIVFIISGLMFSSCTRYIAQSKRSKQFYYTCPMHPSDIYYLSGNCPKCSMVLEQWEMENMSRKNSGSSHSGHSSSGGSNSGCH